ncbi:anthranilate phosphoribosyltransferase [Capillibacterium thermochitinicola]|uniref:Anthranilate phosphoribosyltransferase n=1 Tax=Capillibacterium thermochitinicola TaxID=2699427 RepID=A0A8J6I0N8_9FIRM|nr:anthranilate phosphoribosyltransferase [Capillibacterium thermochitinicola]MBA2132534.1 anthranilate phosphoribosyltransferase [Capillibacterium thermochitinicola]
MIKESLAKLARGEHLEESEMIAATKAIMEGRASPAQIGSFLTALRLKGETVAEITGAARVMREKAVKISFKAPTVIDTCGTGGDGAQTFNISTTVAFIVAAAGIPVAKHGNRAISSRCGSADVLEALGVKVDLSPEQVEVCLREAGVGFLFAPLFHQAMKHAAGPRKELGFRTVFNLLGPLTNPAAANCQLVGVFAPELTEVVAQVLQRLGVARAVVVHGGDGLDELSLDGVNKATILRSGQMQTVHFQATDLGLPSAPKTSLVGGGPAENARITEAILRGTETGPRLNVVLLNAAAALLAADVVNDLKTGIALARDLVREGKAYAKLEQLRHVGRRA